MGSPVRRPGEHDTRPGIYRGWNGRYYRVTPIDLFGSPGWSFEPWSITHARPRENEGGSCGRHIPVMLSWVADLPVEVAGG